MEEFNSADILKKQNRKKRLAFLEVGLFEASFVLIIIIVLFGILNYFNILSLSALYPNQLGFLPHKVTSSNLNKPNTNALVPTKNPTSSNKYSSEAGRLTPPEYVAEIKSYSVIGVFDHQNANSVSVVTKEGPVDFTLNNDTIYEVPPSSADSLLLEKVSKEEFFKRVNAGKNISIIYKPENLAWKLYWFGD